MPLNDKLGSKSKAMTLKEWTPEPGILLSGGLPWPMHGTAPRVVLGQAWWNKERQAAYRSTNFHCLACGVEKAKAKYHQWLEAHELFEIHYQKGRMKYLKSVPLCHFCHNFTHRGRLQALLEKGEIHHAKFVAVIQHGEEILAKSGIKIPPPYDGPFAECKKWRLVIGRNYYKGLFLTVEDWENHHSKDAE